MEKSSVNEVNDKTFLDEGINDFIGYIGRRINRPAPAASLLCALTKSTLNKKNNKANSRIKAIEF